MIIARYQGWIFFALLLAGVSRGVIWLAHGGDSAWFLQPDSHDYLFLGQQLFGQSDFPSVSRTPVYPVFLGFVTQVLGLGPAHIAFLQIIVSLVTLGLIWWMLKRYWLDRISRESLLTRQGIRPYLAAALVFFAVFGLDFISAQGANYLLSETLFTLIIVVGAILLMEIRHGTRYVWINTIACGLVFGLATLCRPIAVFLPCFFLVWGLLPMPRGLGFTRARPAFMGFLMVVLLISSLFPAAWMKRNEAQTGVRFLTTISSINLYEYRAAWNIARRDGREFEAVQKEFREEKRGLQRQLGLNDGELADEVGRKALTIIKDTPWETVQQGIRGFVHLYFGVFGSAIENLADRVGLGASSWITVLCKFFVSGHALMVYLGILALSVNLFFRSRSSVDLDDYADEPPIAASKMSLITLSILMVVYFTLLSVGVEAYARFRLPMIPFLGLLSIFGWMVVMAYFGKNRTPWRIGE